MEWTEKAFLRLPVTHLICSKTEPRLMIMDYPGNDVCDADDNQVPGSILIDTSLSKYYPTAPELSDEYQDSIMSVLEEAGRCHLSKIFSYGSHRKTSKLRTIEGRSRKETLQSWDYPILK